MGAPILSLCIHQDKYIVGHPHHCNNRYCTVPEAISALKQVPTGGRRTCFSYLDSMQQQVCLEDDWQRCRTGSPAISQPTLREGLLCILTACL